MRRREFIAGLGSTAAWPVVARAQQPQVPVVGFLTVATSDAYRPYVAGFRQGLSEVGFAEGRNVEIEFRWGNNQQERLPQLAADLASRKVGVMFVGGGGAAALAAKEVTSIPVVFAAGVDPVQIGMVASLNRPGGNVTGVTYITFELTSKRLGVLRMVVPNAITFGLLTTNPELPLSLNSRNTSLREVEIDAMKVARALGWEAVVAEVRNAGEFDAAFATFAERRIGALSVAPSALTTINRSQLIVLSARYQIPTLYGVREFPLEGGLMSYGASIADAYRLAGHYVGRILKGEKPADLPVQQSTKFELVINLKTAKALGITIPETLLATADEVIQ
jgi:putative ABC transport system substrate-binding protein